MPDSRPLSDRKTRVHPLLQTARGLLTDEHYVTLEIVLAQSVELAKDLEAEVDRLREAGIRVGMRRFGLSRKSATGMLERELNALAEEAG